MIRQYKLHKIAGPSGTFAGYVLLAFGIITSIFVLSGIVVLIIGFYLSFGYFCSTVDADNRRVRSGVMLFGWAISGKWIEIDDTYKTEIRKVKDRYTVYSSANRSLDMDQTDYKIFIFSTQHSKRISLAVFDNQAEAQEKVEVIRDLLQLKKPE
jgi:hypothetical protein